MKKIFLISFIAIIISACQNGQLLKTGNISGSNLENKFFTLDFENDHLSLEDFKEHFFTTFPHEDPTLGNVVYDMAKWENEDIVKLVNSDGLYSYIKLRGDSLGYDSFRLTTKSYFNINKNTERILFVFKGKLPSTSGLWPAWWLNGSEEDTWVYNDSIPALSDENLSKYSGIGEYYDTPSSVNSTDWPSGGEIDIIENVNGEKYIHNTIHTCPQMCDSEWNDDGIIINCANANSNDVNPGCSGKTYEVLSTEGTFACLLESNKISFYYWDKDLDVKENSGPLSRNPNPEKWNNGPLKNRVKLLETDSSCDDNIHLAWQCENCESSDSCKFKNLKMIFNTTVCGVWAGNKFDETANSFVNCNNYIFNDGKSEIDNQFMKIEYVSVQKL